MKKIICLIVCLLGCNVFAQDTPELFSSMNLSTERGKVSVGQGEGNNRKVIFPFEDTKYISLIDGYKLSITLSRESALKLKIGESYTVAYQSASMRNTVHYTSSPKFVLDEIRLLDNNVVECMFIFQMRGKKER
jgi:hypothetical protein